MNLIELRTEFQAISGRLDLSTADLSKYINQGIKFLDEVSGIIDFPKRHFIKVNSGTNTVVLPASFRSLNSAYGITTEIQRRLLKAELSELRPLFNIVPGDTTEDIPVYYAPISILSAENITLDQSSYYSNWSNFQVNENYDFDGLLLYPQANVDFTLEITGNFYSPKLTETRSNNYWSVKHSDLVISAAMYKLDTQYRNVMGAESALKTLMVEVRELYFDRIEFETNDKNLIMEG